MAFLKGGGMNREPYAPINTVLIEATMLKTNKNTYSFTHVEHSQYIVLIQQENRCVHCYIVVKCRHHVSKVIITILLKHLKITTTKFLEVF
jgi:hypothetical protein